MVIIPKPFKRYRLRVFWGLTWVDLIMIIIYAGITIGICLGFSFIPVIGQVVIGVIIMLLLCLTLIKLPIFDLKIYQVFWLALTFIFKKKKLNLNESVNRMPYKKIKNNVLVCFPRSKFKKRKITTYLCALEIFGQNLQTQDPIIQKARFQALSQILRNINSDYNIVKVNIPLEINEHINEYENISKKAKNSKIAKTALNIAESLENSEEAKIKFDPGIHYYLFINSTNEREAYLSAEKTFKALNNNQIKCQLLTNDHLLNAIKNTLLPLASNYDEKTISKYKNNIDQLLAFSEVKFKAKFWKTKSTFFKIQGITEYPIANDEYWLEELFQYQDNDINCQCNMILKFSNPNSEWRTNAVLSNAIYNGIVNTNRTGNAVISERLNFETQALDLIKENVAHGTDQLKTLNFFILHFGNNKREINIGARNFSKFCRERRIIVNEFIFNQYTAYQSFLIPNYDRLHKFRQEIPVSSVGYGFPFTAKGLNDKHGLYLGINNLGSTVFFDQLKINSNRVNHNMLILGMSGNGKSTFIKKLINDHIIRNRKVIIIDPEREYQILTNYYNGQWIDSGNATDSNINPLEILSEDNNVENAINEWLRFLDGWIQILIPEFGKLEINYLIGQINEFYKSYFTFLKKDKKIDSLDKMQANLWPTFSKLLEFLKLQLKNRQVRRFNLHTHQLVTDLIQRDFVNGKYSKLYNEISKLKITDDLCTCIDVYTLFQNNPQNIQQAQLALIVAYINSTKRKIRFNNPNKQVITVVDEAHLLLDERLSVALDMIFQGVKRDRKLAGGGGWIISTQNPEDLWSNETNLKKTMAIFNNSQYLLFLRMQSNNIENINKLLKNAGGLTDAEQQFLIDASPGTGLFFVDPKTRFLIEIDCFEPLSFILNSIGGAKREMED